MSALPSLHTPPSLDLLVLPQRPLQLVLIEAYRGRVLWTQWRLGRVSDPDILGLGGGCMSLKDTSLPPMSFTLFLCFLRPRVRAKNPDLQAHLIQPIGA